MTEAVFYLRVELGYGLGVGGDQKDWIVTKAVGAGRGWGDPPFTRAFGAALAAIGTYCAKDAAEPSTALRWLGIGRELGE